MTWQSIGLAAALVFACAPAFAGGGADVVDDSAPETPGHCHVESWAAFSRDHSYLLNASPACTFESLPEVEFGASIDHAWSDTGNDTTIGPTLKWNIHDLESGWGIALSGSTNISVKTGEAISSAIVVPVSVMLSDTIQFNTDIGWLHESVGSMDRAFYGTQLEYQVTPDLNLMVEGFGRSPGRLGTEARLRWTPGQGPCDLDIFYGAFVDGISPRTVTIGFTFRI